MKCDMIGCNCPMVRWYFDSLYCPAHYPKDKPKKEGKR